MIHRFDDIEIDEEARELRQGGAVKGVEPQVFDVLVHLITNRDRVVAKEELLDEVWGSRFVSESALTSRVKTARQVVGDSGREQSVIRTVHGRGYRFVAPLLDGATRGEPSPDDHGAGPGPDGRGDDDHGWELVGREAELEELTRLASVADPAGVLFTGAAGMGKTQLAREALARAEALGWSTARVHGHTEARDVPLACLAHLLPADALETSGLDGDMARSALFQKARTHFDELAAGEQMLLLIDDVDQVDALSLALIGSLITAGSVVVVMTQRTDDTSVVAFEHLLHSGRLHRIDVTAVAPAPLERLVVSVLGGAIAPEVPTELVRASGGNPGMLRQLVESALSSGVLSRRDAVWTLTGPLATTGDMATLVDDRLGDLDEAHRSAAEILALAGALDLDLATEMLGEETLDSLERQGMVEVRDSSDGIEVLLAHPLFGEVLRGQLQPLRSRRLKKQLADAVEAGGPIRPGDRLKLVRWRLEGGGELDTTLLLDSAVLALVEADHDTATKIVQRLKVQAPSGRVTQLEAELLFVGGRFAEAGELLRSIELDGVAPDAAAFVVRRVATSIFYGQWQQDEAMELLWDHFDRFEGEARATLEGYWVMLAALDARRAPAALELGEELVEGASDFVKLELLCGIAMARFVTGRLHAAMEAIEEFNGLVELLPPSLTWAGPDYAQFVEIHTLTELADLPAARAVLDRIVAERGRPALGFLTIAGSRFEHRSGRSEVAIEWLDPLVELAEVIGLITNARPMQATTARCALTLGDHERARREVDLLEATLAGTDTFVELDLLESIHRVRSLLDDPAAAVDGLVEAAARGGEVGNLIMEASLLAAAAESGGATRVVDRLEELSAVIDGELVQLKARHARCLADGGEGIESVADRYEELGYVVTAARVRSGPPG